jgi:hypothetical protein
LPRREREQSHGFDIAMQKASRLLGSPLNQIGKKLCDFLNDANRAFKARELDETSFSKLVSHVADTVDRLPQSFSERFQFDAALIKGIATDWGEDLALSSMIMPHHHSPWGHVRLPMPSENLNDAHVVDVIHMPGPDDLGEVDLLAYPWIIHEMGHYLLLRYSSNFVPVFKVELEGIVSNLRLASIADRGSASTKAHRILEQLARLWNPSHGQRNWAHELAIDLISVWTCGPAYLACFQDAVEKQSMNPYEVTETHPPFAVRADALITAAKRLGLQKYTGNLQRLTDEWRRPKWMNRRDSRFLSLARPELIKSCSNVALSFCESLNLARCTPEKLENLPQSLATYNSDDIGLDLLLFAWFIFEKKGGNEYSEWESKIVRELAQRVTQ